MRLHFDLTDVRLFVNIAEANSLTGGAERTHMSLPSASNRIKNFEDHLGMKLLHRANHGVTLTPAGQAFLHHSRLILQQIENLRNDLQDYVDGLRGHVRIWANTTAMSEYLPWVLPKYLAQYSDVSVDLRERLSHDIVRGVVEGKADIGIVAGNVRTEGLEVIPYHKDRLVLIVAKIHPLAQRHEVHLEETLAYSHVGLSEASAIHTFLKQAVSAIHRTLQTRIQVSSFDSICRLVEANVGVGVVPLSVAKRYSKTTDIAIVSLADVWAVRDLQICVRNLKLLPGFCKDLVRLLVEDVKGGESM